MPSSIPMKSVLLSLAACALLAAPLHAGTAEKLEQIFQEDTLGADVAWLQGIAGVPLKTDRFGSEIWQTYKIGKCKVETVTDGHKVLSLSMDLSPMCTFDIGAMNANFPHVMAHEATFGAFDGVYGSDCITGMCGNAVESSVTLEHRGSRAENFINVTLSRGQNADDILDAVFAWRDHILKHESQDYVDECGYNDGKYNAAAQKLFRDVRIDGITFSRK